MRTALLTLAVVSLALIAWTGLFVFMPFVGVDSDRDGDGIPDSIDSYPFDRDNDGIRDEWDRFPDYDAALKVDLHSIVLYSNPFGLEELDVQIMITVNDEITIIGVEMPLNVSISDVTYLNHTIEIDIPDDVIEGTLSFAVLAIHSTDASLNHYLNLNQDSERCNISYIFTASPNLNESDSTSEVGDEGQVDASLDFTIRAVALNIDRTLSWQFEGHSYKIELNIKMHEFYFYESHDIPRYHTTDAKVRTFITAEDAIIDHLAQEVTMRFLPNWSEGQKAGLILAMIQSLEYAMDNETSGLMEYWSFPVETLFRGNGDCEDSSFLLASLYKNLGFQCVMVIFFPTDDSSFEGHMGVAVSISEGEGFHYVLDGENYYYAESTGEGWRIGEIHEDYIDADPILVPV